LLLLVLTPVLFPFVTLLYAWAQPLPDAAPFAWAQAVEYGANSLWLVLWVLFIALPIGCGCAWLTTRREFPLRRWLDIGLTLPLAIPAYLLAIVYGQLFSSSGPLQRFIREQWTLQYGDYWFPVMRSPGGAAFVLAMALFPYAYLLCRAALMSQGASMLESARLLGANSGAAFLRVTLPMLRPALAGAGALIAMETLADFGVVSLYASPTFTTGIYRTMFGLGDHVMAIRLGGLLLVLVALPLWYERRSRAGAYHALRTADRPPLRLPLQGFHAAFALVACALPCVLGFVLPVVVLVHWSLAFTSFWQDTLTWQAAWHSLLTGVAVAGLVTLLAVLIVYALRQGRQPLLRGMTRLLELGYGLPGIVIAVSIMLPLITFDRWFSRQWSEWTGETQGLLLTGTIGAIILACTIRFMALGMQTVQAGMQGLPPALDMASRSLGIGGMRLLWRVHLPILMPSLMVSLLIVFVDTVKELPATYLLRPFNFDTLAIRAFELASDEKYYEAAPSCLMLITAGVLAMMVLQRFAGRASEGR
jgi:iron(III) transport system permease protein